MPRNIIIAIDGPASAGKSTLAKDLAQQLGYIHVDSGSMYRAVTLYFLRHKVNISDLREVTQALEHINISVKRDNGERRTILNGEDVEEAIRSMEVSQLVSAVSAIPEVRQGMVKVQREVGKHRGLVMDGRDIGTVVFPDAELKIFMIAEEETRAGRRQLELHQKGVDVSLEEVKSNLHERDRIDSEREVSPLRKANDAIVLDNSALTEEQQLEWAWRLVREKIDD